MYKFSKLFSIHFPKECLENLIKDLCNFPLLITLIILTTISLENVFKLLGEN